MNLIDHYDTFYSESISKFTLKNISKKDKSIFLDRDGILIEDVNHIRSPHLVQPCKNLQEFLKFAKEHKYHIIVVTNQSSVSRGIISYPEYIKITEKFLSLLPTNLYPENILTSFHLPNNKSGLDNYSWRKPGIGMFEYALKKYNLNPNKSIMVGDKLSDLIPADNCKFSRLIYIKSNLHSRELDKVKEWNLTKMKKIEIFYELDFVKMILNNN